MMAPSRRSLCCVNWVLPALLSHALLCFAGPAHASVSIAPVDMNTSITIAFDKSAPPSNAVVWDQLTNGYTPFSVPINQVNRNSDRYQCQSETDTRTGACSRARLAGGGIGQISTLKLRFTEKRSKVSYDIPLHGRSASCALTPATGVCRNPEWRQIQNGGFNRGKTHSAKMLHIYFTAEDLATIPAGGIWEGQLILEQRPTWFGQAIVAHWTANITLDVTDRHHGAIWLPAFGRADPLVDLNLRTKPLSTTPGGEVSGSTVIDTCLYDGYNSNNPWLQVTLSDLLPPGGREKDIFSVAKTGTAGSGNATNRVDYRIAMNYNGQPVTMENGKAMTLTGVDTALIRPVVLPGFPVPVVCTPAPLTLTVQPFSKASKTAGRYSGTLRINLAARTLAP